jgi:hypothetical protein
VRQAEADTGSALERAAGDQQCGGDAGLDGHPGPESDSGLGYSWWQVLVAGMHKHQGIEFGGDGEESVEALVAEFAPADLRADFDTEESRMTYAAAHLVDGLVGVLQRDGAQCGETGRVLGHDPGEEVVLSRRQFGRAWR